MNNRKRFVTGVFWLGALLDGLLVIPLLWPGIVLKRFQIPASDVGPAIRFPAYVAASLMAGWTALLAWGAVSPIERRGLLLITACPAMVGLITTSVYVGAVGPAGPLRVAPMLGVQLCVLILMLSAGIIAKKEAMTTATQ